MLRSLNLINDKYLAGIATSTLEAKCLSLLLLRLVLKEKSSSSQLQNLTFVVKTRSQKIEETRKFRKGDDIFFNLFPLCEKCLNANNLKSQINTFVAHFNPRLLLKTQLAVTSEPRQIINFIFRREIFFLCAVKLQKTLFSPFFRISNSLFLTLRFFFFTLPERALLITFS